MLPNSRGMNIPSGDAHPPAALSSQPCRQNSRPRIAAKPCLRSPRPPAWPSPGPALSGPAQLRRHSHVPAPDPPGSGAALPFPWLFLKPPALADPAALFCAGPSARSAPSRPRRKKPRPPPKKSGSPARVPKQPGDEHPLRGRPSPGCRYRMDTATPPTFKTSAVGNSARYARPGPRNLHDERASVAAWRRPVLSLPLAAGLPPLQRKKEGFAPSGRKPVLQRLKGGGTAPVSWPGAAR
jgi:hypothetical protein